MTKSGDPRVARKESSLAANKRLQKTASGMGEKVAIASYISWEKESLLWRGERSNFVKKEKYTQE